MNRVDPAASPLNRLRGACLDWTREVRAPDISKIIFEIGPGALGARKAKEIEDRNSLHRIESLLSEAIDAGELSAADPKLVAAFLNALVAEAGLYDLRTGRDSVPTLDASIDALFAGMRP